MSTTNYKNQPGLKNRLLAGKSHVYRTTKRLWPEDVEDFIASLMFSRSLNVCSGYSKLGDVRLDVNAAVEPDVIADATRLPFADESFDCVLCDPPYPFIKHRYQWNHDLLSELSRVAKRRIIFQHWFMPSDSQGRWKKWHKFNLSDVFVWQPRTYFGRVQVISVFDANGRA